MASLSQLRPDFGLPTTKTASASRPPQQFIQSANSIGGFGGLFPQAKASSPTTSFPVDPNQGVQGITSSPAPSSGGSGGSGVGTDYNATKDAMTKGQIPWDDNLLASLYSNSDAELSALNTAYDQNAENLRAQESELGRQRSNTLSSLSLGLEDVKTQVGSARLSAQGSADQNYRDSLSTAQEVERRNRNAMRALGILGSSAAGELLQKPYLEYDKQRAQISTALTQRLGDLDTFLNQKVAEHSNAIKDVEGQYAKLVGDIQRDLRFNDRQRADAVKSANAALQNRVAEIKMSMMNFANQAEALKNQTAMQLTQMKTYSNPSADPMAIYNQAYTGLSNMGPQQVSMYGYENPQKKQGLLSAY